MVLPSIGQGWLLCFLSSLMCILGCLLITIDLIYKTLLPQLSTRYPFKIQENSNFLIASLSLSGGSLIFTSMFKLLPEGQEYYNKIEDLNSRLLTSYLIGFYLLGILICGCLNLIIHFCTSESVVHCVHDHSEHHHTHQHDHEHADDHSHTHTDEPTVVPVVVPNEVQDSITDETTALIQRPPMPQRQSLIDLSLKTLNGVLHGNHKHDNNTGKCHGYESFEKCVLHNTFGNDEPESSNSSNTLIKRNESKNDLHYCELPTPENLLFFQKQLHSQKPNLELIIHSPFVPNNSDSINNHESDHDHDDDEDSIKEHQNRHHHHITTPISRLLSIGLQTILAISLHKLPEGLIMYSTSKANPSLGLTIFLSLLIHNFVEGFTMCLPMYLALNSRWKLILLSGLIGGSAQPVGAILGWFFFKKTDLSSTIKMNFLFGNLMSLTSGFLTIIGFQMFASAMAFGGTQRFVLIWVCIGITLIGLSYILIGKID